MSFGKLKLGTKLMLMFGTLIFFIICVSVSSFYSLGRISGQWHEFETVTNAKQEINANAIQHLGSAVQNFKNYILRAKDYDKKFDSELNEIEKAAESYKKAGASSSAEDALLSDLANSVRAYRASIVKVIEMKTAAAAITDIDAAIKGMDKPIETALNGLKKINSEATLAKGAAIQQDINLGKNVVLILSLSSIAISILMGALFTKSLLGQLGGEPDYAAEIAMKISSGDLSGSVTVSAKDSKSVLFVMKEMQDSLIRVVSDVRASAMSVASGSSQIANGNSDLSARTEAQAGSLEETASSIEEITSTAEKSAEHTFNANKLTQSAAKSAENGGVVVGNVVNTMKEINASSQKITDIISVIDGIAFQTNILALNAAVEAARAGEQGRGFAVVASEVRNLAQRSALAAKEIKELIGDSVSRVGEGARLVDQAGSTMDRLLLEIRHVSDIVNEISNSSKEQNAGLSQINQAIMVMDQTTQENAAMVEQIAAAAMSLQQQSQQLLETVAVFTLPADSAPIANAAHHVAKGNVRKFVARQALIS